MLQIEKMSKLCKVALVEDDTSIRAHWETHFAQIKGSIFWSFGSAEEMLEHVVDQPPDVVLMDIGLPGMDGVEATRRLVERFPGLPVLMFTIFPDEDLVFQALRAGASGYILKTSPPEHWVQAIDEVLLGGAPMTPMIARKVIAYFQPKSLFSTSPLTRREKEILRLLAQGKRYKDMAEAMGVSADTIRTHVRNVYLKLSVHSRMEAVKKWEESQGGGPGFWRSV
jgi:DNA-binding NarL/FixJ family response regulator